MHFITISEMLGTNGEKIAKKVAQELNYPFIGKEELEKAAAEMGFLSDIQKVDEERNPPFLEKLFSQRPKIYIERMQAAIYEIARKGDAVFLGRGSMSLLHSFNCALHVLVTGSLEKRIERVMEESRAGREIAEKMIHRSDHEKRAFFRFAFDEDWLNPHLYDLILNTDKLDIAAATEMILDAANSHEIKACGIDSLKALAKLSILRRIEASLIEIGVHVSVTVEDDLKSVQLYGLVHSQKQKEEIADILKKFKEIKSVVDNLTIPPAAPI
jgi:cytidylate kinase